MNLIPAPQTPAISDLQALANQMANAAKIYDTAYQASRDAWDDFQSASKIYSDALSNFQLTLPTPTVRKAPWQQ